MAGDRRISIPYAQRWRRFRYQAMPFLTVAVGILLINILWRQQGQRANAVGEVEAFRIDVAANADGLLVPDPAVHPWTLFASVTKNEIVARLDDGPVRARLATMRGELARLEKEIDAAAAEAVADGSNLKFERHRETLRLTWEIEKLRLDILDRQADVANDQMELRRLEARVQYFEPLRKQGNITELEYRNEEMLRAQTAARIQAHERARDEAVAQAKKAAQRLAELPDNPPAEIEQVLSPLRADVARQESAIKEIERQLAQLEIHAPINGTITAIHSWPGKAVRLGDPILTIAADHGGYIVSYVRDAQQVRPLIGARVAIRSRTNPRLSIETKIEAIGPQVEAIPPHQLRDPAVPEWGLPVKITIPPQFSARPGELIDITFERDQAAGKT